MMTDQEIAALAKATVPIVRQCVNETFIKATVLPPELAEQVASAIRLLHESPQLDDK
jgi:hypothetical protein